MKGEIKKCLFFMYVLRRNTSGYFGFSFLASLLFLFLLQ